MLVCSLTLCSRPSGAGGQGVISPHQKNFFLSMCPFLRKALEVLFLKEVTKNVHENITRLLIRFYRVENSKSITFFLFFVFAFCCCCCCCFGFFFFEKKGTKNLTTTHSIIFLSVLHQNEALHNFHKRRQCPTVGLIKGLD